jgi:hypothetical protein
MRRKLPLRRPHRRRGDGILGAFAAVFSAAAFESADDLNFHVVIAQDLAAEAQAALAEQSSRGEHVFFCLRHLFGFTRYKLHPASRTASVAAARVELIYPAFIRKCKYKTFVHRDVSYSKAVGCQFGHNSRFSALSLIRNIIK